MRLPELQRAIRASILEPPNTATAGTAEEALALEIDGQGLTPAQRLQVYRNNSLIGLAAALTANFPVTHRLVGDGFFQAAATAFIPACPPREPRLSAYGAPFPEFIADYPPAGSLPYLPDVARLEWAVNRSSHADDAPALTAAVLEQATARQSAPTIRLHPASHLLASPWPIERIWRANQPGADPDIRIDLDEGGCRLLAHRDGFAVAIAAVSPGSHALLSALAEGLELGGAYERAVAIDPLFDLAAALATELTRGSLMLGDRTPQEEAQR